jgi:hypothetical protein
MGCSGISTPCSAVEAAGEAPLLHFGQIYTLFKGMFGASFFITFPRNFTFCAMQKV